MASAMSIAQKRKQSIVRKTPRTVCPYNSGPVNPNFIHTEPKKNKATKALKAKATPKCKPLPTKQPRRIVEDDSDEDMPDATQNPTVENNNSEDTTAQQATLDNEQDDDEQDEDEQEQDEQDQDVRDQDVQGRDFQASYNQEELDNDSSDNEQTLKQRLEAYANKLVAAAHALTVAKERSEDSLRLAQETLEGDAKKIARQFHR
ncbi:uncharacterized protein SEPMUDRAFT_121730 [Sphaerulina musiva SO2202]|uniref:Uncharacterized protein n=1 Tax=Sphaerulina musiva (strain SO2202) TaxID=692275 RepID=M3AR40_SPHMS|nr:uncharacterized protein SEPMUDRAFT_121730 [Sphaerulina musiva SO2202]EMF07919.1 hypothetical protein SEPMUDRAFT_121730 [Sphaerulina musiva SO2202]